MAATLLVPPEAEPVSLDDLKGHLRIDDDAQDVVLARLIAAARAYVEAVTRRVLVTQTWRVRLERWPATRHVVLPIVPARQLLAIRIFDASGAALDLPLAAYMLDNGRTPPLLRPVDGTVVPLQTARGIEIDIAGGYGPPASVPAPLREAVLRLAALWHENRLAAGEAALGPSPPAVAALIAPYRVAAL